MGLEAFPREDWPNVRNVHLAFQVMVGLGSAMALLALGRVGSTGAASVPRAAPLPAGAGRRSRPLGFIAIEAGWLVTEWGRQPWIVHGVMRTAEAVTPVGNSRCRSSRSRCSTCSSAAIVIVLLRRQIARPARVERERASAGGVA